MHQVAAVEIQDGQVAVTVILESGLAGNDIVSKVATFTAPAHWPVVVNALSVLHEMASDIMTEYDTSEKNPENIEAFPGDDEDLDSMTLRS